MAKEKKRPMDQAGSSKEGTQKSQDTLEPKGPPSRKKKKINEAI